MNANTEKEIIAMRKSGQQIQTIIEYTGYSKTSILRILRAANLTNTKPKPNNDEIVRLFRSGYTAKQIMKQTGWAHTTIYRELTKQHLHYNNNLPSNLATAIIADYKSGMSSNKIAAKLGLHSKRVLRLLKKTQTARRTYAQALRRYQLNEDFFDTVNTEAKAYWFGFILADGQLAATGRTKKSTRLRISLQHRDKEHLELFRQSLNTDAPIRQYNRRMGEKHSHLIF